MIARTAKAPPVKSQGIKTRLVPFIASHIEWDGGGRWIEPFVGSGAVAFNIAPQRALLADTNEHLIRLYRQIQAGSLNAGNLRSRLEDEGRHLEEKGETHYYYVRDRFNEGQSSFDFLFLNRSCFNGVIRFNRKGQFNTPFCRKPDRFRPAYVTRICNQVDWLSQTMTGRDWQFRTQDWSRTLGVATAGDFIYLDPPYVGRYSDYFSGWSEREADRLAIALKGSPAGFAYSMWMENRYRRNPHIEAHFAGYPIFLYRHFYHVGPSEGLRNEMQEALVVSHKNAIDGAADRREARVVPA